MKLKFFLMLLCLQSSFVLGMDNVSEGLNKVASFVGDSKNILAAAGSLMVARDTLTHVGNTIKEKRDDVAERARSEKEQQEATRKAALTKFTISQILSDENLTARLQFPTQLKSMLGIDDQKATEFGKSLFDAMRQDSKLTPAVTQGSLENGTAIVAAPKVMGQVDQMLKSQQQKFLKIGALASAVCFTGGLAFGKFVLPLLLKR